MKKLDTLSLPQLIDKLTIARSSLPNDPDIAVDVITEVIDELQKMVTYMRKTIANTID